MRQTYPRARSTVAFSSVLAVKVIQRALIWTTGLCSAIALVLAVLAILLFARLIDANAAWVLVAIGIAVAVGGWKIYEFTREQGERFSQKHSQVELLQAQLDQQQRSIDSMADGLDVAIFICDARASIQYANRVAMELFRFEHPIGRSVLAVTLSHDLEQLVVQAHQTRQPQGKELVFSYPEERMGLAKAWPPGDDPGRVFLSIYDITDLRRLERIRQDFVANVSHELRTPLTIIRAMAETLLDDGGDDHELTEKYLSRITTEVDRLSMISQDLLVLSAAESNPVRKQSCDLAEVVRVVVSQLSPKASDKGLELNYEGDEELIIEANPAQMTQVALNLIDNAINYTLTGKVNVRLFRNQETAEFTITDTGIGIASEHLPRIFERFYRVDKARSRSTGGTGLGLSIVKHIVEAHGGQLTVQSSLNVGSTFRACLPIGNVESEAQSGQA